MDDPTFTNPVMYSAIHSRSKTIPQKYADEVLNQEEKIATVKDYSKRLNDHFKMVDSYEPANYAFLGKWSGLQCPSQNQKTVWDTGVPIELLMFVGAKSAEIPANFNLHPTLNKVLLNDRANKLKEGKRIDWATAESLAIGSLLYQGFNVRISGQDVGRGTFSQRHAMISVTNN